MKLAIVRQKYTPFGGAERFIARALEVLRRRGVTVEIVARSWQEADACVKCDPFYLGRLWRDSGFARCVRNVLATRHYDLVQSHERIPGCQIFRVGDGVHATWLDIAGKPLAAYAPWHRYTLAAEAATFRHPDLRAVICNSRMVADDVARRFPAAADKLHVIHNGVDLAHFFPGLREMHRTRMRKNVDADRAVPIVLYVGSGFARKGVATLIEALARMRSPRIEAWIVGRDKNQSRYEHLAERLGVGKCVRFFGGQTDVRPFYGAADVFCLPTRYDPFPNAALEALACGLPVVTTSACGIAELIEPGRNGHVCEVQDPAALASSLDALCAPGVAAAMADAARAAAARCDLDAMADRLVALYGRLMGASS